MRGGKRDNAGRKRKDQELHLIGALDDAIGTEEWVKIIKIISEKAQEGSYHHAKLLMEYRFGKPVATVDVTTTNNSSLDLSRLTVDELVAYREISAKARIEEK